MEVNEQTENSTPENQGESIIEKVEAKKIVAPRKPAVRKTVVKPKIEVETIAPELEPNNEMLIPNVMVEIESITYKSSDKLNKKNLKKLKKMKEKAKEKEQKAKDKQKEKEKKAKKKKKDRAKKEKAKKKLKEKKAKKKASAKKRKSKK